MLRAGLCDSDVSVCLSVRLSVCYSRYCIKTERASVMISSPPDSPMICTTIAQLLQPSYFVLACSMTAYRPGLDGTPSRYAVIGCKLKQNANDGCNSCASLAQDLFYVLLHALLGRPYVVTGGLIKC